MLNILIPMSGMNRYEGNEYQYPKPLIEIDGLPMIERVVNLFHAIAREKHFIFVVNEVDCTVYHLDNVLELITGNNCSVIKLSKGTKGAACSALMAIEHINDNNQLIISNSDHFIAHNLDSVITSFEVEDVDAGVICFESVHPKWSFVRLDSESSIIEAAEKRPLSKNAIAGFYYFNKGSLFVTAAMKMIKKGATVEGRFYIAPTLNELVLDGANLKPYRISQQEYFNFYSPNKIKDYEIWLQKHKH